MRASGCMSAEQVDRLYAGEVGYLSASIKAVADARVGDTITLKKVLQTLASSCSWGRNSLGLEHLKSTYRPSQARAVEAACSSSEN